MTSDLKSLISLQTMKQSPINEYSDMFITCEWCMLLMDMLGSWATTSSEDMGNHDVWYVVLLIHEFTTMIGDNRQLVTDEPVEFEK